MADSDEKKTKSGGSSDGHVNDDEELAKLLDSSLQDFGKSPGSTSDKSESRGGNASVAAMAQEATDTSYDQKAAQEAALQFQTMLKQLSTMQKAMVEQMQQADSGSAVQSDSTTQGAASGEDAQFAQAFLQNINFLAEKAQKIQEAKSEDEFEAAVQQLQADSTYESELLPFMQGLMGSLLSKDMLYPALKEMCEKYPKWLDENRDKTDAETLKRYETQHQLIQDACKEYEDEKEDDTEDVKGQRFERVIVIMQKMQACGHPPEELVGSLPPGWALDDSSGLPRVVDDAKAAEACSVM